MNFKLEEEHLLHFIKISMEYLPKVLLALATLIIGFYLISLFIKFLNRVFEKKEVDPTLTPFLKSFVRIILKVILFISVASMVGIETSSLLAMLGAASLAIGLALQGSLSNIAGGVLILFLRPFRVGHIIETNSILGTVEQIQLFYTVIKTPQGQRVTVPNGMLSNNVIRNITHNPERRIDLAVGIAYHSNIQKAKSVLEEIIRTDNMILKEPEYRIFIEDFADSSMILKIQIWVLQEHYWEVLMSIREKIKKGFDENNIEIPFPQRVIHHAK